MLQPKKLPISIKEARKLLGKSGNQLSDAQVLEIIHSLSLLARRYFITAGSKKQQGQL